MCVIIMCNYMCKEYAIILYICSSKKIKLFSVIIKLA